MQCIYMLILLKLGAKCEGKKVNSNGTILHCFYFGVVCFISILFKRSMEISDAENKVEEDDVLRKQLKENNHSTTIINMVYKENK